MSQKSDAQLKIETDNIIKVNGNSEITPPKDNALRTNIIDSKINKEGGNVVTGLLGYTTDLTPTDDKHIVPKKYVDDSIASASVTTDATPTDGSANPVQSNGVFDALATKLNLSGGTMSGSINMGGNNITHVAMIFDQDNIAAFLKSGGYRTITGVDGEGIFYLGTLGQGVGIRSLGSTFRAYIKPPASLPSDVEIQTPNESGTLALTSDIPEYPTNPASDGIEYFLKIVDGVKSWEAVIDANGTDIDEKTKLQAGGVGDWVDGSYQGALSGAITGTKGGERFTGQDATDALYYRYECITDNNWIRTLLS